MVSRHRELCSNAMQPLKCRFKKVRFGATPKPAHETRALLRHRVFVWRNYCAHSSKAVGSPRRCARTSPAKWSEPVIKIGFDFARASINESSTFGVME